MSEYINVEKPFLEKLKQLGWDIIDQGTGIPQKPEKSLRKSFREVTLEGEFKKTISRINKTADGREWLTDDQLDAVFDEITTHHGKKLFEANKDIFHLLTKNTRVRENTLTNEQDPIVRLIDFENWENNSFIAINQFRIKTPGGPREGIIPDIVLFVNGLPFIVVECKDTDVSEPLLEAEIQIRRYSNRRDDDFGIKEGEERLFHFNLFSIITHSEEARFGTISADFDYYYNWKDIFPEEYRVIEIEPGKEIIQEVLIRGMLNKEILIDVLRHFTLFMEIKDGEEVKVVSRYQQYRAVGKILKRLREGITPNERSGVVWHTQGSGKSLTMVFLVRKLRSQDDLKDYKIILVNDRIDLEDQLSRTARLTEEKVNIIDKRKNLRSILGEDSSNLNMVMMHKFLEEEIRHSKSLMKAYVEEGIVPEFKPFEVVNDSERILMLIDEAHRTQGGDMGDNLFSAFPNATKIAFTGTPLLTERHKIKTHERFGGGKKFIDEYKIRQSVKDRATLDIVYIGRTSKDRIIDSDAFQDEFEDMFKSRTSEEKQEIQKRYGTMQAYLENMDRLRKISEDIVSHYVTEILPNGFKAQVVASSVNAAARYKYLIEESIKKLIEQEKEKPQEEMDNDLVKKLEFLKISTIVTKQENNEAAYVSEARRQAREINAIENFKRDFDLEEAETGVAFLCVCDRLITGFDAPVEQVMYLDKNMREHDLLQAIARVNRPKGPRKTHGIVVDYFGVAQHLKEALAIYGEEDEKELSHFLEYFRDINKEIPVLESRHTRLIHLFLDNGINNIEAFVNQEMTDKEAEFETAERCIELAREVRFRARFDTYLKSFFDSMDLLFNVSQAKRYWIPSKRFGYLYMRVRNRYKDDTMDLKWAGEKVRKLIDKYLESLGIDSRIPPVSLLSDDFPKEIDKHGRSSKAKASEMEHAIRRHIKINMQNDPAFYTKFNERLESIIRQYQGHWDMLVQELEKMREDIKQGREEEGAPLQAYQMPFYDVILMHAFEGERTDEKTQQKIAGLVEEIVEELQKTIDVFNFWNKHARVRKLQGIIDDILSFSGIDKIVASHERIGTEILNLARKRHEDLIRNKSSD